MKTVPKLLIPLFLFCVVPFAFAEPVESKTLDTNGSSKRTGLYLGRKPPGMVSEIFAKGIISTSHHEHSAPAISPDGKEIYWSLWEKPRPQNPIQKIYYVKRTDHGWTVPQLASFSGDYSDGGPCFACDNKRLFFSSRRPLSGTGPAKDRDIWFVERTDSGWGPPRNLGSPVNTELGEGSPTLTKDGTLYFTAHYAGVKGNYGIYRSRQINGKYIQPEPLPKTINSNHYDWTPFISPDENYLIFASGRKGSYGFNDLYISFNKENNNWSEPQNMGPVINNGSQVRFPTVSPDGKYLFFNRSTPAKHDDVFWIDAKIIDHFRNPVLSSQHTDSLSEKTLRLGVNNWLFWRKHNQGAFSGADVDVWREIARRNDFKLEYTFIPNLKHLRPAIENDSIDVFVSLLRTAEREEYLFFIEPPFRAKLKYLTYVRADSDISINTLEDMHGKKIAVASPGAYDRFNNDPEIEKQFHYWNTSKAFQKLLDGTVDAAHVNQWQAIRFFRDERQRDKFVLADYSYSEYHACHMVMSKKSPLVGKWKDHFGQTIQHMIDDGTMKRIIDSYAPDWYEVYPPGFQK